MAVAEEYGWPNPTPEEKTAVQLDSVRLQRWVGRYRVPGAAITVDIGLERDSLRVHVPDGTVFTLVPQSDSTFFALPQGFDALFAVRGDTAVVRMAGLTGFRMGSRE